LNLATLGEAAALRDGLRGKVASGHVFEGRGGWNVEDDAGGLRFGDCFGFDAPEQGPYAFIETQAFVVIAPTETVE